MEIPTGGSGRALLSGGTARHVPGRNSSKVNPTGNRHDGEKEEAGSRCPSVVTPAVGSSLEHWCGAPIDTLALQTLTATNMEKYPSGILPLGSPVIRSGLLGTSLSELPSRSSPVPSRCTHTMCGRGHCRGISKPIMRSAARTGFRSVPLRSSSNTGNVSFAVLAANVENVFPGGASGQYAYASGETPIGAPSQPDAQSPPRWNLPVWNPDAAVGDMVRLWDSVELSLREYGIQPLRLTESQLKQPNWPVLTSSPGLPLRISLPSLEQYSDFHRCDYLRFRNLPLQTSVRRGETHTVREEWLALRAVRGMHRSGLSFLLPSRRTYRMSGLKGKSCISAVWFAL